jgi:hypothetical protein
MAQYFPRGIFGGGSRAEGAKTARHLIGKFPRVDILSFLPQFPRRAPARF